MNADGWGDLYECLYKACQIDVIGSWSESLDKVKGNTSYVLEQLLLPSHCSGKSKTAHVRIDNVSKKRSTSC